MTARLKTTYDGPNNQRLKMNDFYPLVSIIIPVYNGSDYMKEAIESALNQTYKNIEILIVNDGSSDNTEKIALSYGDRIRYFLKENGGTSTALNLGIKNMRGEYFSWLSHDDIYFSNKIQRQVEELRKLENKNSVIRASIVAINEKGETIYSTNYYKHQHGYPLRAKSKFYPVIYSQVHGCDLLIPKISFDEVGLFDEKKIVAQDYDFFYRLFLRFPQRVVPEILVTVRDRGQGQGRIKAKLRVEEYSKLFISMMEQLGDEDFKLLAPTKLDFYREVSEILSAAGYTIAVDYINKKTIPNLQICFKDLVGNKFNGYDMHRYLRGRDINSNMLVQNKYSNDETVLKYDFSDPKSTYDLMKTKVFLNAEIIHLHLIHNIIHNNSFDLNYLPMMSKIKPVIITLHDPYFLSGHCVHHFDCMKWQNHCFDCPYLDRPFKILNDDTALRFELKKQAIQNSNIYGIVASKWMEEKVKLSPIWAGKKIYKIPFGIDLGLFKPEITSIAKKKLGINPESITFMFRATTNLYKGLDIIIAALRNLELKQRGTIITVEEKGLLNDLNGKYELREYGWLNDDSKLVDLYQACDVFLMPSKQETFGMMAIEAMSCGKVVLAIKNEGSALSEVINSPQCGIAVDESEYASELQRLVDDPDLLREHERKSVDYAKNNYDKEIYVNRMVKVYEDVIVSHGRDETSELIIRQLQKHFNSVIATDAAEGTALRNSAFFKKMGLATVYKKLSEYRMFRRIWPRLKPCIIRTYTILKKIRGTSK